MHLLRPCLLCLTNVSLPNFVYCLTLVYYPSFPVQISSLSFIATLQQFISFHPLLEFHCSKKHLARPTFSANSLFCCSICCALGFVGLSYKISPCSSISDIPWCPLTVHISTPLWLADHFVFTFLLGTLIKHQLLLQMPVCCALSYFLFFFPILLNFLALPLNK